MMNNHCVSCIPARYTALEATLW